MTAGPLSPIAASHAEAIPAGAKLITLVVPSTALLLIRSPWVLGAAAFVALTLGLLTLGAARLKSSWTAGLALAVGALALFTLVVDGALPALVVLLRLVALIVFAQIVTGTTRASAIQDALVSALRPFERLPFVSAEKAGLALAIALRSLPRMAAAVRELREAREARCLAVSPHRLVIPLVARILKEARETADAIDARSWSGAKEPRP